MCDLQSTLEEPHREVTSARSENVMSRAGQVSETESWKLIAGLSQAMKNHSGTSVSLTNPGGRYNLNSIRLCWTRLHWTGSSHSPQDAAGLVTQDAGQKLLRKIIRQQRTKGGLKRRLAIIFWVQSRCPWPYSKARVYFFCMTRGEELWLILTMTIHRGLRTLCQWPILLVWLRNCPLPQNPAKQW